MAEKTPQFTVSDRRKFTLEGELREGEEMPTEAKSSQARGAAPPKAEAPPPHEPARQNADLHTAAADTGDPEVESETLAEPTAEESAQQSKDYQASARQLDDLLRAGSPHARDSVAMNFDRLVQSIYMTAAMQMGAGTAPDEQPRIDIVGARQSIDMLGVLEEKTKGNLTEEEKRLLQNALFDLRMSFLEITNAIANSAQQRPSNSGAKK